MKTDLNHIADAMAEKLLREVCTCGACEHIPHAIKDSLKQAIDEAKDESKLDAEEQAKKEAHDKFFDKLFKSIEPYERRMQSMLRKVWDEERRIILANLKKMKKAWLRKDAVDNILYPTSIFEKKIARETEGIFVSVMNAEGARVIDEYDFGIAFDVENPEVKKFLKAYVPKFAKELEATNIKKLRKILLDSMEEGLGIPEIRKKLLETFSDWSKFRAEKVARNEILRASNKAALETYRMAGVRKKIWATYFDSRTCFFCEDLDGTVVETEENYFDEGDAYEVKRDGKTYTMNLNYTDIDSGNLHSLCRCTIIPVVE